MATFRITAHVWRVDADGGKSVALAVPTFYLADPVRDAEQIVREDMFGPLLDADEYVTVVAEEA